MTTLIKALYRGDGDYQNHRQLKFTLTQGMVRTNLASGGIGREIFEQPLVSSIKNHVNDTWKKTHFLSFSEDIDRAISFGKGRANKDCDCDTYFDPDDDTKDEWDFIILTLTEEKLLGLREIECGVYSCYFIPGTKKYQPLYPLILIDVLTVLSNSPSRAPQDISALSNARRDKEWLILPAFPEDFVYAVENSAYLDCAVFSQIEKYSILRNV